MKQTAVEYAIQGIEKLAGIKIARDEYFLQEAYIIFEQQIIDAFEKGLITENVYYGYDDKKAEQYYNETFKSE